MRRLWPPLAFVWPAIIVAIVVNILSGQVAHVLALPGAWPAATVGLVLVAFVTWLARRHWSTHRLQSDFDLFTTTSKLKPEDMGLARTRRGENVMGPRRPYFDAYIPRIAVPYAARHTGDAKSTYDEAALAKRVGEGEGFLLIGQPTEGKTRTLYEVLSRVQNCVVVRPRRDRMPSDQAFTLLKDARVVCLVDDLNYFVEAPLDLLKFFRRLTLCHHNAPYWGRVATAESCRHSAPQRHHYSEYMNRSN
ncbi:MAG: hypothetical protein GEU99_04550 [Luteitalea sp.]|nr:hypothetical protein [Luteitalea sp.]